MLEDKTQEDGDNEVGYGQLFHRGKFHLVEVHQQSNILTSIPLTPKLEIKFSDLIGLGIVYI